MLSSLPAVAASLSSAPAGKASARVDALHRDLLTRKSLKTQEILQTASAVLDVASNLAPLIPVPVLYSIFIAAKGIVDISIKMRKDKRESAELAEYAATLTSSVHKTIRGKENMIDKVLSLSLNHLSSVLEEIKEFMERQVALRFWERLCTRSGVSEKLAEYRSRLEYVMQTFITTSNLRQEMSLKYLRDGMDDLKETLQSGQTFDGQFRIYRWGEIEIIHPHDLPSESYQSDIEIYDAKIDGSMKVVKVYRNQNTFLHSRNVLKLVRECPRLPFAQLEGYTSDSTSPFLVLKGGLTNMFDYLKELDMMDYFAERLGFMIDMKRAMMFLASHGFRWKGWVEKLMISESGRLAMGYADDVVQRLDSDSDGGNSRIMISWPKPGIAEGLHVLVERDDNTLVPLRLALQTRNRYDLNSLAILWGRYIDELSCGTTSFVTITNSHPPSLGSVGYFGPEGSGIHFEALLSSYTGKVNVRTTGQVRPRTGLENVGGDVQDFQDAKDWRNFAGEEISMPLLLSGEIGSLLSYRTSYAQLHGQSCVVEHLVRNCHQLSLSLGIDLESLVIVSGVIERASVTFSGNTLDSSSIHESMIETPTFFHPHPPDECGFLRKPWGYISKTINIITDEEISGDVLCSQNVDEQESSFRLILDEIVACTEQSYKLYCFQFSPAEAAAVRHMCRTVLSP